MDAEAKSDPMEGNTHRNVQLGLQNLQVPISLSKYTIEQFREYTEYNNPVVFECLENHKTGKKVYWAQNANFFSQLLLQTFFPSIHI